MESVVAYWEGSCCSDLKRDGLAAALELIGKEHAARFHRSGAPRDILSEVVRDFNDEPVTGRVLLDSLLVQIEDLPAELVAQSKPIESPEKWERASDVMCCCAIRSKTDEQWHSILPATMQLHGVDFRLYDPRGLFPGEDRASFVSLVCPAIPSLDGRLVSVTKREQCQEQEGDFNRVADWYLSKPTIRLQHYLEDWIDLLLTWVKSFYIPDLHYWRRDRLSRYEAFKRVIDDLIAGTDSLFAKDSVFEYLVDRFEEEVDRGDRELREIVQDLDDQMAGLKNHYTAASAENRIAYAYANLFNRKSWRASEAARDLAGCGASAFPVIARALHDPALKERWFLILEQLEMLGEDGLPLLEDVFECFFALRDDPSLVRRTSAWNALASMGEGAYSHLRNVMRVIAQEDWKYIAACCLGGMWPERQQTFLMTALCDEDETVKLRACEYIRISCDKMKSEQFSPRVSMTDEQIAPLIPALIQQMNGAKGRLREVVSKTLENSKRSSSEKQE